MNGLIEALRQWVRTIVVVVLVAGFLDLLAPSGGTRRLVRLVLGLVIVITVVAPLATLVRRGPGALGVAPTAATATVKATATGTATAAAADGSGSLAQRLSAFNTTMTDQIVARSVAVRAETAAMRVPGVGRARAVVELDGRAGDGSAGTAGSAGTVRAVWVEVWLGSPAGSGGTVAARGTANGTAVTVPAVSAVAVAPVTVGHAGAVGSTAGPATAAAPAPPAVPAAAAQAPQPGTLAASVQAAVAAELGLPDSVVAVQVHGGG